MTVPLIGRLELFRALDRTDLLAPAVADALFAWPRAAEAHVAEIDATLADTEAFCAAYDVPLDVSANCVIVVGRRGDDVRYAACLVLATTRIDVNGLVRRRLDARKASFAAQEEAVALTGMAYGGITAVGLPADWPLLVDPAVLSAGHVVVGSGFRQSKLVLPGAAVEDLPGVEVVEGLGRPVA